MFSTLYSTVISLPAKSETTTLPFVFSVNVFESDEAIRYKVKNTMSAQLTHLLEFGHQKSNGKRFEGKPHIRVARDNANKKYVEMLKQIQ